MKIEQVDCLHQTIAAAQTLQNTAPDKTPLHRAHDHEKAQSSKQNNKLKPNNKTVTIVHEKLSKPQNSLL